MVYSCVAHVELLKESLIEDRRVFAFLWAEKRFHELCGFQCRESRSGDYLVVIYNTIIGSNVRNLVILGPEALDFVGVDCTGSESLNRAQCERYSLS